MNTAARLPVRGLPRPSVASFLLLASVAWGQCEEVGQPPDFASGFFVTGGRGVQFECHAGAVIDQWGAEWFVAAPDTFRFVAWESTDSGATWGKLDQDDVAVPGGPYQLIYTSTGRNITLVAGRRYAFIVYTCGTGDYNSQLFGLVPTTTSFGYFTSLSPPTHALRSDAWHSSTCDPTTMTTTSGIMAGSPFELLIHTDFCLAGPSCVINSPAAMAAVSGIVTLDVDFDHVLGLQVDATFDYSTDAGATWNLCTPATGGNPVTGIMTPTTGFTFQWDSVGDGVGLSSVQAADLRITVDDGSATATCSVAQLQVDNQTPPPTCTLVVTSATPVRGIGGFELVAMSPSSPTVDVTYSYSTDGGATYTQATPGPTSLNPALAVPTGAPVPFTWDTVADGVAPGGLVTGVLLRAELDDGAAQGSCVTAPFDADNGALCTGLCGDCNEDGAGPSIIDALVAAQIAAGLLVPTPTQTSCCDVNSSLFVDVIDALLIAQESAGLPTTLVCP